MSLPILIDMNLSMEWVPWFDRAGWPAVHWSTLETGKGDGDEWH